MRLRYDSNFTIEAAQLKLVADAIGVLRVHQFSFSKARFVEHRENKVLTFIHDGKHGINLLLRENLWNFAAFEFSFVVLFGDDALPLLKMGHGPAKGVHFHHFACCGKRRIFWARTCAETDADTSRLAGRPLSRTVSNCG